MQVLGPATASAIEQFLAKVTIPVLLDDTKHGMIPHGTGAFFDIEGRSFLILAGHLLDEIDPADLAVPVRLQGTEVKTLGMLDVLRPTNVDLDVAALELKDSSFVSQLRSGWRFLGLSNVASPSQDGAFILAGYPAAMTEKRGGILGGRLLTFYTERLEHPPDLASFRVRPHDPKIDFFFKYDVAAMLVSNGEDGKTPALPGASGASIWEWHDPQEGVHWTPELVLKVVAVQSGWNERTSKWFRATGWGAVLDTVRQAGVFGP